MATLSVVIANLQAEVEGLIEGIDPTDYTQARFQHRDPETRDETPIFNAPGRVRLFEVGEPENDTRYEWIGSPSTRARRIYFPIVVGYQNTPQQRRAAADDADRIADLLHTTPTSVTGVEIRHMDYSKPPTYTVTDDGSWLWATHRLWAIVEITP